MKKDALQLEDLKVSNLPELQGWKEKQQKLVEDNPYVEIVDNKSYDVACKSRTALLKGRTELEKQDKLIASKLTSFRKEVKQETDNLIAITLPYEEKQQSEIKRYEEIKASEKAEKERLEQERVDCIKNRIDNCESECYRIIQDTTIDNVELHKTMIDVFVNANFDYEEFDILFEQSRARIQTSWDLKCADIQEKESQRVENERLQKEAEQARIVSELQASRLNELTPYIAYGEPIDLTNLHSIEESVWHDVIASKKALFEAKQNEQQEANAKIEADRQKIFEIRKKRISEIDPHIDLSKDFVFYGKTDIDILNCDVIDFETIITDAKLAIEKAKEQAEKAEQQRLADEKLAKEDAERLKKENKDREKRLANDKKIIAESLETYFADLHLATDNEESSAFIITANTKTQALKIELLTELNNL